MSSAVLSIKGLKVAYGGIQAVKGVDLEIRPGELVTLIGANGAGKTTTLKAITGGQAWHGEIEYMGRSLKGRASHELLAEGLAMVPEGRGVFARMTVTENLQMGAFLRNDRAGIAADIERMFETFPRLKERARQLAGTLSGGERQMLAIGRALMARPRLLMLDEPSLGLAPRIVKEIFHIIDELRKRGGSILLVEQNARAALQVADYAYVLETGEVALEGPASALAQDRRVIDTYLGIGKQAAA